MGQIYRIFNKVNGKSYIGMTTKTFDERYAGDWIRNTKNIPLLHALEKYNRDDFAVEILIDDIHDEEELKKLEKSFADRFDSYSPNGYNLVECGRFGGKMTEEMKVIISETTKKAMIPIKDEIREKIIEAWKDEDLKRRHRDICTPLNKEIANRPEVKKIALETLVNNKDNQKKRLIAISRSQKVKDNLKLQQMEYSRVKKEKNRVTYNPIVVRNITTGEEETFLNVYRIYDDPRWIGSNVLLCLRGKIKSHRGYRFRKLSDESFDQLLHGNSHLCIIVGYNGNDVIEFNGLFAVESDGRFTKSGVYDCLVGRQKTHKGYIFRIETRSKNE